MRASFVRADFDALAELWCRFMPPRYAVDAALLRSHTVESPLFDWGASAIELEDGRPVGFVVVKKSANPVLFKGPDPDAAHVNSMAFDRPEIAVDLLAYAKGTLRNRGVCRLVFGQDSRHFFPGCPADCPQLSSFLMVEGFECSPVEQFDVERDLRGFEPDEASMTPLGGLDAVRRQLQEGGDGDAPRVAWVGQANLRLIADFLEREFPGRWHHDVLDKIGTEGHGKVLGLFEEGVCHGFALTQQANDRLPIGGAVWCNDLGPDWGSLGPIGVSKAVRGRGLGKALLGAGLWGLSLRGAKRTIIDWTTLVDFYGAYGFEVSRTYRSLSLRLEP